MIRRERGTVVFRLPFGMRLAVMNRNASYETTIALEWAGERLVERANATSPLLRDTLEARARRIIRRGSAFEPGPTRAERAAQREVDEVEVVDVDERVCPDEGRRR